MPRSRCRSTLDGIFAPSRAYLLTHGGAPILPRASKRPRQIQGRERQEALAVGRKEGCQKHAGGASREKQRPLAALGKIHSLSARISRLLVRVGPRSLDCSSIRSEAKDSLQGIEPAKAKRGDAREEGSRGRLREPASSKEDHGPRKWSDILEATHRSRRSRRQKPRARNPFEKRDG